MHGWSTKRITYTGMFVAIAMVFSYLESMIPVNIAVPGSSWDLQIWSP